MAIACPIDLDTMKLRQEIQAIYGRVATEPMGQFHFHRGPVYASGMLGYDAPALAALPPETTAAFAGVANPHRIAPLTRGATVVDIGCGAGMDLMLAAMAVGPTGSAIGVDMTDAMAAQARAAAGALGLNHVEVRLGDALDLPVESESVDFVISNGVLNWRRTSVEPSAKSSAFSSQAVSSSTATSLSRASCPNQSDATSTCGPVESPALCRRQSSCRCWESSTSRP